MSYCKLLKNVKMITNWFSFTLIPPFSSNVIDFTTLKLSLITLKQRIIAFCINLELN